MARPLYLARKFGDHPDVRLLPSAAEELTPAFVAGLNRVSAGRPLALFFDAYERTSGLLDQWLRDLYAGRYGALPATLVTTIAGRSPLDPKLWGEFLPVIGDIPLGPFSEAAARQFLASKGITDDAALPAILTRSGGLPVWLATLGSASPGPEDSTGDVARDAAAQFLDWQDDPARRSIAAAAALPRWFDEDVLAVIAPPGGSAGELLGWLRSLEFVTPQAGSWAYHEVVRSAMLQRQRTQALSEWRAKHSALARAHARWAEDAAGDGDKEWDSPCWIEHTCEKTYHLLCANPINNLHQALALAVKAAEYSPVQAHQWAWLFADAGRDIDHPVLREWGQRLLDGFDESDLTQYLTCLIADGQLPDPVLVIALTERGGGYRRTDRGDEAQADFSRAIELSPGNAEAITSRGETFRDAERYDEALADFDRAIELDPGSVLALVDRAETYRLIERHGEDALADFDRAIELDPGSAGIIVSRGETYHLMRRYDDALADFDRAIEFSPGWAWAIIDRGETYRLMERYDDALADFNRAIQLDPGSIWALINRAETFHLVKQYDDALADLNRALELTPGSSSVVALRGEIYGLMERYDDALADFTRAIELDPGYAWAIACRGETYQLMERYDDAIADVDRAIELEPDSSSAVALRGEIYRETGQYDEALADLNHAIELDPGYAWAIGSRGQTYREMGRHDEALADLNHAIELDPGYAWAIGSRGQTYRELGRHDEALADLNHAIGLDPSLADTFGAFLAGPPADGTGRPAGGTGSPAAETTGPPAQTTSPPAETTIPPASD